MPNTRMLFGDAKSTCDGKKSLVSHARVVFWSHAHSSEDRFESENIDRSMAVRRVDTDLVHKITDCTERGRAISYKLFQDETVGAGRRLKLIHHNRLRNLFFLSLYTPEESNSPTPYLIERLYKWRMSPRFLPPTWVFLQLQLSLVYRSNTCRKLPFSCQIWIKFKHI